ncbi:YmdB family metallophosphoesterase [Desulfovibrio sp. OttesenSCG-928-A18]|nr:YmdB family metallophosphoesterase [Desulfovibrio sp. OttesenSCG-928-A18]
MSSDLVWCRARHACVPGAELYQATYGTIVEKESGFSAIAGTAGPLSGLDAGGVRLLCLGDIVGRPGRSAVQERLPLLRASLALDFVIANGENAAGGIGLTPDSLDVLLRSGVDCVTSGNHIWRHREIRPLLDREARLLRPCNYSPATPGRGFGVYTLPGGLKLGVLNLLGRVFMDAVDCPFRAADAALARFEQEGVSHVVVDFHAEASSEKRAMAQYLDGRATLVFGTHTHVQTADARISALGTASITDIGMCGVEDDSVIGMGKEVILRRFVTGVPEAFKPARGQGSLNGVCVEADKKNAKALSIFILRDTPGAVADARLLCGGAACS